MSDEDVRRRLARLIVDGLEIGTRKQDTTAEDLFAAFGVRVPEPSAGTNTAVPASVDAVREAAAEVLAAAAPGAAALFNELLRCGGRFVDMVDAIYARLKWHAATTAGTSDTFRLERGEVEEDRLTISPAFIEEIHRVERRLARLDVGRIDSRGLDRFIRWDNGELYGTWPFGADLRLPDSILNLAWMREAISARGLLDGVLDDAFDAAEAAATRLVSAAERIVRAHLAHLGELSATPADTVAAVSDEELVARADSRLFSHDLEQWDRDAAAAEFDRFRTARRLGGTAVPGFVSGIDAMSAVGLDDELQPFVLPTDTFWRGSGVSFLAGFVAMWREGRYATRSRQRLEESFPNDPAGLGVWLQELRSACGEATRWLTDDVLAPTAQVTVEELADVVQAFLDLPLWRRRDLLYEVWVLTATLDAAESASWDPELSGLSAAEDVWVLSLHPAGRPVAVLRHADDPSLTLDVWREPSRTTASGPLTPDVTVSTPGPHPRDLVVVEAKDRHWMHSGAPQKAGRRRRVDKGSALGVGRRYVDGLRAPVTWLCNHCDFDTSVSAASNHGDVWTRLHLAAQFRPRSVPPEFTHTVRLALSPPIDTGPGMDAAAAIASPGRASRDLTLVIDVTGSMRSVLQSAWEVLRAWPGGQSFRRMRAVLYSDHGDEEPFLVRKLGPFPDFASLLAAVAAQPEGEGGDEDEALEDAIQRCRELVDDVGPHTFVVLTDAQAHPPSQCPYGIDVDSEVGALLDAGCAVLVASDWQRPEASGWDGFEGRSGFRRAPLDDLLAQLPGAGPVRR